MENNSTSVLFIRCPDPLLNWIKATGKAKGFRSTQEFVLQILREYKEQEVFDSAEIESSPVKLAA